MLHSGFPQMLQDADRCGTEIGFNTNGTIFPESVRLALPNLEHLVRINVSIDSSSAVVYEDIRGGKVAKALKTLETIGKLCGERMSVTASAVAMKSTVATLPDLVDALAAIGIGNLVVQNLHDQSREGLGEQLGTTEGAAEALARTRAVAEASGVQLHFEDEIRLRLELEDPARAKETYLAPTKSRRCDIAWEMPHIDSLGGVYPCCRASAVDAERLGNLAEESFTEIWNGEAFRSFRARMLGTGDGCPEVCSGCTAAPVGRPLMAEMGAELLLEQSVLDGAEIVLIARNIGAKAWTRESHPTVGTRNPRDRASPSRTAQWLSDNRACGPVETFVLPGETARFMFDLGADSHLSEEWFALVMDGEAWLPGTMFQTVRRPLWEIRSALPLTFEAGASA